MVSVPDAAPRRTTGERGVHHRQRRTRDVSPPAIAMSHARFRPADHSKGDESTIGGYAAVHDRPAAFEGSDGFSYSVELMTEETGDRASPWAGFILFVKWARLGAQTPEGHLESDYLVRASSEPEARRMLGATPLGDVKA